MTQYIILGATSLSSSAVMDSKCDISQDSIYKWESVRVFIYLAETFSSSGVNFDMFSGVIHNGPVPLFMIAVIIISVPHMFIDFFIKQYTGKVSFNEHLNPLLKGVNYGILMQTAIWAVNHSMDLTEILMYLFAIFKNIPLFNECHKSLLDHPNDICIHGKNITILCSKTHTKMRLQFTSTHYYYNRMTSVTDRTNLTRKVFLFAMVWLCNFFFCSLSEQMIVKIFKITFVFRTISTLAVGLYIMFSEANLIKPAFKSIMQILLSDINITTFSAVFEHAMYAFGIGVIGVYDFGSMSPFTMIDTAVIIFAFSFTLQGVFRSMFIKIIYMKLNECFDLDINYGYHYFLFAVLPLSSNLWKASRLILLYLFLNMIFTLCPHIAAITFTSVKMLHTEFKKLKIIYLSGIVSFSGFVVSICCLPLWNLTYHTKYVARLWGLNQALFALSFVTNLFSFYLLMHQLWPGIQNGLQIGMVFLGCLKIMIIVYLYGVSKLSNDIKFWLGFTPISFWIVTWSLLPVWLFALFVKHMLTLSHIALEVKTLKQGHDIVTCVQLFLTMLFAVIATIRVIGKYVAKNKFSAIFKSNNKYGPPDMEERKQRKKYDEAITRRFCLHDCVPIDDKFECSHARIQYDTPSLSNVVSSSSLVTHQQSMMRIFKAPISGRKETKSEIMDIYQD